MTRWLSLHRWYLMLAVWLGALGAVCWYVLVPLGRGRVADFQALRADRAFVERAGSFPREIRALRRETTLLDSLLRSFENRKAFEEAQVVEEVYALADSAACSVAKVEIGEPIGVRNAVEIPITFTGRGSYESIGTLVDGIENSDYATRVRQVLLTKTGDDEGKLYLDFVVMEGR